MGDNGSALSLWHKITLIFATGAVAYAGWIGLQIQLIREDLAANDGLVRLTNERVTTVVHSLGDRFTQVHSRLNAMDGEINVIRERVFDLSKACGK